MTSRQKKWLFLTVILLLLASSGKFLKFVTAQRTYWNNGRIKGYREVELLEVSFHGHTSDGKAKSWYEDGKLESIQYYKDGKLDGRARIWGENGRVLDDWTFVDGKPKDGKRLSYFEDGKLSAEYNYLDGKLNGQFTTWNKEGLKTDHWTFDHGLPNDGERKSYYDSGTLKSITHYQDGKKNGVYLEYEPTGVPRKEESYVNDFQDGLSRYWLNGQVSSVWEYERGKIRHYIGYDLAGRKTEEKRNFTDGSSAEETSYFESGRIQFTRKFNQKGMVISEAEFDESGKRTK